MKSTSSTIRPVWTLLLLFLFLLHCWTFQRFLTDDALISLRYAKRFLMGHGLTWTDGEQVEGYSNLLWILLVSLAAKFGLELVTAARALGVVCMSLVLIILLNSKTEQKRNFPWAELFFITTGPIAAWSVGGLEQALLALLLTLSLVFFSDYLENPKQKKSLWSASLCLGLLSICRPDGILFCAGPAASILLFKTDWRKKFKESIQLICIPAAMLAAHTAFRILYYGEWVSNVSYAKIAFSSEQFEWGVRYIVRGYSLIFGLFAATCTALWLQAKARKLTPPNIMVICATLIWTAYIVFIGGDVNPPSRHFVPIIIFLCVALKQADLAPLKLEKLGFVFPSLLLMHLIFQALDIENNDAKKSYSLGVWRGKEVGLLLKQSLGELKPLLAVDAAGAVPYWSELPSLDMLGLNDRFLAHNPPVNFGTGWIAHGLGSGDYILKRSPDLIIFGHPFGSDPGFLSGRELTADTRFLNSYTEFKLQVKPNCIDLDPFVATIWVKNSSQVELLPLLHAQTQADRPNNHSM